MTTSRPGQPIPPSFVLHYSVPFAWSFLGHPYYEQACVVLGMLLVSGTTALAAGDLRERTVAALAPAFIRDPATRERTTEQERERLVRRAMLDLEELLDRRIVQPLPQPRWNPNAAALTGRYGIRTYEDAVDIDVAIDEQLPLLIADDELRQEANRVAQADPRFRLLWLPDYVTSPEFRRGWRPL